MISLISILVFIGVYLWYATSRRLQLDTLLGMEAWSRENPLCSKVTGSLLIVTSGWLAVGSLGVGAGILTMLVLLLNVTSLVVLCTPVGLVNRTSLIGVAAAALILEILL